MRWLYNLRSGCMLHNPWLIPLPPHTHTHCRGTTSRWDEDNTSPINLTLSKALSYAGRKPSAVSKKTLHLFQKQGRTAAVTVKKPQNTSQLESLRVFMSLTWCFPTVADDLCTGWSCHTNAVSVSATSQSDGKTQRDRVMGRETDRQVTRRKPDRWVDAKTGTFSNLHMIKISILIFPQT